MYKSNFLEKLPHDRQINNFPSPYKFSSTPYQQHDFSDNTKKLLNQKHEFDVNLICKVIILGDVCVGKTSIINRFRSKLFDTTYKTTIGVDFQVEPFNIFGIPFNLQIWDTAGQERFKSIAQSYYRGAHVVVIVFDLSSIQTLANCKNWLDEALTANKSNDPLVFIVGTKRDLLSRQACENAEIIGDETARCLNGEFWSVSSKTGENIERLFIRIAALSFDNSIKNVSIASKKTIKIGKDLDSITVRRRKKCCE